LYQTKLSACKNTHSHLNYVWHGATC